MKLHASYDCIVVGGGISGLYSAIELQKKYPEWSIAIIEKYKGLGGRTYSYSPPGFPGVRWEMGAGRIQESHILVKKLVKKYGLHLIPIHKDIGFQEVAGGPILPNPFEKSFISMYIAPLGVLPESVLKMHTLYELMVDIYGQVRAKEILDTFPYWAEVHVLRADLALKTFLEGEMHSHEGYSVIQEGFSELIARMVDEFSKRGGVLLNRQTVVGLKQGDSEKETDLEVEFGRKKDKVHGFIKLRARKCCIFAVHADALRKIRGFHKGFEALQKVKTEPLFRIYAIFKDSSWFPGRFVTPSRLRYFIPIDLKNGVVMISYTDGKDTEEYHKVYMKGGDEALQKAVMKDIRMLLPEKDIPEPLVLKGHYWDTGATYWLPGNYDVEEMSFDSCRPLKELKGIYMCGESFSLKQAWVEGALEQTEKCLSLI